VEDKKKKTDSSARAPWNLTGLGEMTGQTTVSMIVAIHKEKDGARPKKNPPGKRKEKESVHLLKNWGGKK